MLRSSILALSLTCLVSVPLAAQPTLVRDVNPDSYVPVSAFEGPRQLTPVAGGAVFFTLSGPPFTAGLWFTDGTAAGTRFVTSFCEPAGCSRVPYSVAALPGLAFFLAESRGDLSSSSRLWRTDGTAAGTFPLTAQLHSFADSDSYLALGGRLLFLTCVQEGSSCSLWRTDGTAAGTEPVRTPAIGSNLVEAGGKAYFLGQGTGGRGLWQTDGTAQGTRLVKAIAPGNYLWNLEAAGSRLFFLSGPDSGRVWTSDGTTAGTKPVARFFESGHEFIPRTTLLLEAAGEGKILLTGIREGNGINLWLSDGTPGGTVRLTDAPPLEAGGRWVPREDQVETLGRRIVFLAGSRLWSSGGTRATTRTVGGCPGGCPETVADSPLVRVGNRVVFAGRGAAHGAEIWVSDGTGPGTRRLADLCPGPCGSRPAAFRVEGGLAWFRANGGDGAARLVRTDGTDAGTVTLARTADEGSPLDLALSGGKVFFSGFDSTAGSQPWVTDGTRGGTRRVTALPGHGGSSDPMDLAAFGDRLLFSATDGRVTGLWTAGLAGAALIPMTAAPASLPPPREVTVAGGLAFYLPGPGGGDELRRTDGTAAGTLRLATFPGQTLSELHGLGSRLVFLVSAPGGTAFSFWRSDGTTEGTEKLFDLPAGTRKVSDVAVVGPDLYFAAETTTTKTQVFRSDGNDDTRPVLDLLCITCTSPYYPLSYTRLGDAVYFTAWANGSTFSGPALWRTDGTAEGTVRLVPDPANNGPLKTYFPDSAFAFGGELYFLAHDPTVDDGDRTVLFRGRDENAVRLAPVGSPPFQPFAPGFTPAGSTLFFRAWDPEHGIELWRTDGTPEGTVLVRDVLPGPASSDPQDLTAAGGRLYFSARDAAHGRELWRSDGTRSGTLLVQDLFPAGLSSAPEQLTLVGGRLFFTADDGVTGREPWSLPVE